MQHWRRAPGEQPRRMCNESILGYWDALKIQVLYYFFEILHEDVDEYVVVVVNFARWWSIMCEHE